ncbi:MAG: aminoglycoside phosphotransferase family protein [Candidatus Pacebacteria bacterium]|nr:aminoglycoside phosphotransferase family protein [Candidatus Paceibacterota bacterium]
MNESVTQICKNVFHKTPVDIFPIVDKGHANLVFKVTFEDLIYILRLSKNTNLKTYVKEKWCMEKAAAVGVPTAQCVALGVYESYAYSFQTYLEGIDGSELKEEHSRIWFTLGKYANIINQIQVKGYGSDLKFPEQNDFGNDWIGTMDWSLNYLFDDDFFQKENILSSSQIERLKTRLTELKSWNFNPVLCHSNLAPKNTIVHPDGTIYVIDWGTAMAHRAPHLELSDVFTWEWKKEYEEAFMQGYGITSEEYTAIAHDVETLVMLRLVDSIKWAFDNKEDWQNVDFVVHSIEKISRILK